MNHKQTKETRAVFIARAAERQQPPVVAMPGSTVHVTIIHQVAAEHVHNIGSGGHIGSAEKPPG